MGGNVLLIFQKHPYNRTGIHLQDLKLSWILIMRNNENVKGKYLWGHMEY